MKAWLVGAWLLGAVAISHGAETTAPIAYTARLFDSGEAVSLATLRGRPVLLMSWATWCRECKAMLPALEEVWQSRKEQGLQVIAVNLDDPGSQRSARAMITRYGLTMPVWRDRGNAYASAFQAVGVPTSVLLDSQGRPLQAWGGNLDWRAQEVQDILDSALEKSASSLQR